LLNRAQNTSRDQKSLGDGTLVFSSAKAWSALGSQPMPLVLVVEIKSLINKKHMAMLWVGGGKMVKGEKRRLCNYIKIVANMRIVISDRFANELLTLTLSAL
jgi:hypothetical protein